MLCSHSKRERSESAKRRGAERIIVELKKLHRALSLDSVKIKENGQNRFYSRLGINYDTTGVSRCFQDQNSGHKFAVFCFSDNILTGKLETYKNKPL